MLFVKSRVPGNQDDKKPAGWDLYSLLQPATRVCCIIGVFPLTLKGPIGGRKYSINRFATTYSFIVIVGMTVNLLIWNKYNGRQIEMLAKYKAILISVHFEMLLNILQTVVIFASVVICREKFANAIDALSSQDAALRRLGIRIDYAADSKRFHVRFGSILFVITGLYIYDFIYQLEFNLRFPLNWVAWMCPISIRIFTTCLFVDILFALKQRLGMLNERVRKMIRERENSSPEMISNQYETCTKLRSVATTHGILCEIALSLNQIFAISIVVDVIQVLITMTTSIYYIIYEIKQSHHDYLTIIGFINWGLMSGGHVIHLIIVCCMTRNEAALTGNLIHKFNVHEIDTKLNSVIQSFSLQLQHGNIEFSGAGLFPLDATLIRSIVGAVATYLVILIQFETTSL